MYHFKNENVCFLDVYMYTSGDATRKYNYMRLISPTFPPKHHGVSKCLSFEYLVFGASTDTLAVLDEYGRHVWVFHGDKHNSKELEMSTQTRDVTMFVVVVVVVFSSRDEGLAKGCGDTVLKPSCVCVRSEPNDEFEGC